ncbi:MAG: hypothetical protein ACK5WI_09010, partial [Cyanobacteriota bacterium]
QKSITPRIWILYKKTLLSLIVVAGGWCFTAPQAMAAEILSIRSPTLLQVGDQNRSYGVQLACISVNEANSQAALAWLQRNGSRGTKINFRPMGVQDGQMVAQVSLLKNGLNLGDALVAEGLASPLPCLNAERAS